MGVRSLILLFTIFISAACNAGSKTDLLIQAVADSNTKQLLTLVSDKAVINTAGNEGLTALQMASDRGNSKFVSILIKNGASINVINKFKQTALSLAANNHRLLPLTHRRATSLCGFFFHQ